MTTTITSSREHLIYLDLVVNPESFIWETVEDVLVFLINTPNARHQLLAEVQRRSQETTRPFLICYHRLPLGLSIHAQDDDQSFLYRINLRLSLYYDRKINIPKVTNFARYAFSQNQLSHWSG